MVTANHALMVVLGIEMASVPCYVLAGILRHRRTSSEAALKYAVFGAAAAGVMLYGISLLSGVLGSAHLPTMAQRLADFLQNRGDPQYHNTAVVLVLGGLMMAVGLAFKLSAVPFHFWAPDVFEGAPAEVGMFLSIASKAAAVALLTRLALLFSGGLLSPSAGAAIASLASVRFCLAALIALLAAVTCTFGNLAAYGQTNMKRLLAYSTIAHAGYMMMPVAAAVRLAGDRAHPERAWDAVAAIVVYLGVYLFMNFGAFAIVAFLRNARKSESIADYAGLVRRSPAAGRFHGDHPLQPGGTAAAGRVLGQVRRLRRVVGRQHVPAAGDRRPEHGAEPVLLPSRGEGHGDRGGARRSSRAVHPLVQRAGVYAVLLAGMMILIFVRWGGLWTIGQVAGQALVQAATGQ